jgi:hypothetical protein
VVIIGISVVSRLVVFHAALLVIIWSGILLVVCSRQDSGLLSL